VAFAKLGCTAYGGPVAHLGFMRDEFVVRRRWLDDAAYADLVALCQFLPGPASSQLAFALGMRRAGLPGAVLASFGFTAPSALLMVLFAYGVMAAGSLHAAGWLHGLKLAAVAVVAQAVWGMGRRLCPDFARIIVALLAAAGVLLVPGTAGQIGVILGGSLAGWWLYRQQPAMASGPAAGWAKHHGWAASGLGLFGGLLLVLPALAVASGWRELAVVDSFYRAGSLVFGGGHVILPLLRAEVVPPGWVTDDVFLAGYGAAQAVPGPLFTLAAYLGTMIHAGPGAWMYGVLCLAAIFLPAWLLIGGALPFWQMLRSRPWAQAAMQGTNAAVVGLLLAALYNPVWREGVTGPADVVVVAGALALLTAGRFPPWLVVLLAAAAGQWLL
jgi:chromate transporter